MPPDDGSGVLLLAVAPSRWLAARRRVRVLTVAAVVVGVAAAAAACALVQVGWPPMLLSVGGVVLSAAVVAVGAGAGYLVGRRLAVRSVRPVLDEVRTAVGAARPRRWAVDPGLGVLLGRDTTLLRSTGRRVVVAATVDDAEVRIVRVAAPRHGHPRGGVSTPAAGGFYGSGEGGWGGGGGDGGPN
jgi:hypothetical protein